MDKNLKYILDKIPFNLTDYFAEGNISEIRLFRNNNICIHRQGKNEILPETYISSERLKNIFMNFCGHTVSVYRPQIAEGFITLPGGHRIGIGGRFEYCGEEYNLIEVTSMSIRIVSKTDYSYDRGLEDFRNGLLIAGPPHSGKTTLLKALCRNMALNIVVCDERNEFSSEIFPCHCISGVNKAVAVSQAVRTLNPDVIVCDEIGMKKEAERLLSFMNTGVRFICTVHCDSVDRLYLKPNIKTLLDNRVFDKIAVLAVENNRYFIRETVNV